MKRNINVRSAKLRLHRVELAYAEIDHRSLFCLLILGFDSRNIQSRSRSALQHYLENEAMRLAAIVHVITSNEAVVVNAGEVGGVRLLYAVADKLVGRYQRKA